MRIRDLGPLTVTVDATERLVSGSKVPPILAMLVINLNRRVSADALMDAAWGDHLTAGAASTLLSHIWRLRQLLEPTRGNRVAPGVVISDEGGYRLVGSEQNIDSLIFTQIAGDVRDLLAAEKGAEAVRRADQALELWRGRPFGTLAYRDWAAPAVARLDEVHEQVLERRVEALLMAGELDRALSDLEPLIAAMPFRERLWSVRMLALYRSGRAEEALSAYQLARGTLIEEIGTEPSPDLQDLHRMILTNDPALIRRTRDVVELRAPHVETHLPPTPTALVGREEDTSALTRLMREHGLTTITGPAGCGKTRLAVDVARLVAAEFSDGVWMIDLTAATDPELMVDVIISTIGFAASAAATPLEDLRDYLACRRILIVLDNCEHVLAAAAELVQLVLGSGNGRARCSLLATSREPLGVPGEAIWTLGPLRLPAENADEDATEASAVALFLQRLHLAAPKLRPSGEDLALIVRICVALDGLPLALELAAARARFFTLQDILTQVSTDPTALGRVGRGPADHRATLRSAIEWSHQMLTPAEQVAHRRLSVLPGPFPAGLADAVIGSVAPSGDPTDLLAQLAHRSMLGSSCVSRANGPTTFSQLATVRAHAHQKLVDAGDLIEAVHYRDDWTLKLLSSRPAAGTTAQIEWQFRVDDAYASVRATLAHLLIDNPTEVGGSMASRLTSYWYYRSRTVEAARWLHLAEKYLRPGGSTDWLVAQLALATVLAVQGRSDLAKEYVHDLDQRLAIVLLERRRDVGEAVVWLALAMWVKDEFATVGMLYRCLQTVTESACDENLALLTDAVGCLAVFAAGRTEAAVASAHEVYERATTVHNQFARWVAAGAPIVAALLAENPQDGIMWVNRAMSDHIKFGTGGAIGMFIETRGNFAVQAGDYVGAARFHAAARRYTRRAGMVWPRRPLTNQFIAQTRQKLSQRVYAQAWEEGEHLTAEHIAHDL